MEAVADFLVHRQEKFRLFNATCVVAARRLFMEEKVPESCPKYKVLLSQAAHDPLR